MKYFLYGNICFGTFSPHHSSDFKPAFVDKLFAESQTHRNGGFVCILIRPSFNFGFFFILRLVGDHYERRAQKTEERRRYVFALIGNFTVLLPALHCNIICIIQGYKKTTQKMLLCILK